MTLTGHTAQLFALSGRVAIVTGGTRGIGLAIVRALAEAGAHVVLSSEDAQDCDRVAAELGAQGLRVSAHPCDLGQPHDPERLVAAALAAQGRIDMLVCNGGIEGPVGPIAQASPEAIERVLQINLKSAIALTSAACPHMAAQGGGSIVLIASIAALRGNKAIGVYAMSKAALAQLARNLAVEWGPAGIRANTIAPGLTHTGFAQALIDDAAFMQRRMAMTPLRRPGRPEEIAATALFLLSDGGGFITGQTIVADGGTLITDGS